jgi:hypothetical protein
LVCTEYFAFNSEQDFQVEFDDSAQLKADVVRHVSSDCTDSLEGNSRYKIFLNATPGSAPSSRKATGNAELVGWIPGW